MPLHQTVRTRKEKCRITFGKVVREESRILQRALESKCVPLAAKIPNDPASIIWTFLEGSVAERLGMPLSVYRSGTPSAIALRHFTFNVSDQGVRILQAPRGRYFNEEIEYIVRDGGYTGPHKPVRMSCWRLICCTQGPASFFVPVEVVRRRYAEKDRQEAREREIDERRKANKEKLELQRARENQFNSRLWREQRQERQERQERRERMVPDFPELDE